MFAVLADSRLGVSARRLCVASVAVAVVSLLTALAMPHHHHSGRACVVVETCCSDHCDNDRHTGHGDDGSSCIEKEAFVVAKQRAARVFVAIHCLAAPSCAVALPPAATFAACPPAVRAVPPVMPGLVVSGGLRAPPCAL